MDIYENTKKSKFELPDTITFLQNLKNEMKLPQDGNDYGKEKVILLMKRIQYYKQHKYRYKSKDNDLSEIVLTSSDLTANCTPTENITDNEKQNIEFH